MECPDVIDGAKVICFARLGAHHTRTGNTRHTVRGELVGAAKGLAICQYPEEDALYLFGCDDTWSSTTDTLHQSLEEAKAQAEFEYAGVSDIWQFKP